MKLNTLKLNDIIKSIGENPQYHVQDCEQYQTWKHYLIDIVDEAYQQKQSALVVLAENCSFELPYHDMGNINTKHLFGIDELIILSFYLRNKNRYQKALDLGANIGLHSLALNALEYQVTSYEADPQTYNVFSDNLRLNQADNVHPINAAAASYEGVAEFTRVCGNLTGSHLSGAKHNPYGELEKFDVKVVKIGNYFAQHDLIKMDIEGQEADVFCSIAKETLQQVDIMMEINGDENALAIFEHSKNAQINLFVQNRCWERATTLAQLPRSHRDGSVFASFKDKMPW